MYAVEARTARGTVGVGFVKLPICPLLSRNDCTACVGGRPKKRKKKKPPCITRKKREKVGSTPHHICTSSTSRERQHKLTRFVSALNFNAGS